MVFYVESLIEYPGLYVYSNRFDDIEFDKNYICWNNDSELNSALLIPLNVSITLTENDKDNFRKLKCGDVLNVYKGVVNTLFEVESDDCTLFVMNKCNSNCIMCPEAESQRKQDLNISIDSILEQIRYLPSNARHITITGGEPFLLGPNIKCVFDGLIDRFGKNSYQLLTNGRAFCDKTICNTLEVIKDKGLYVCIPIYGPNADIHDSMTRAEGSFKQTCVGIQNLINMGVIIELRIVVTKINYLELSSLAKFIVNNFNKVGSIKVMAMEMLGNAAVNAENVWIEYECAANAATEAVDILVKAGLNVELYNFPLCMVNKKYWSVTKRSITENKVVYYDECANCSVKKICSGIFDGTKRYLSGKVVSQ